MKIQIFSDHGQLPSFRRSHDAVRTPHRGKEQDYCYNNEDCVYDNILHLTQVFKWLEDYTQADTSDKRK